MKVIKYTLNADGTIPEYVTNGGYFPVANGGISPQDYDLIGMANDVAHQASFANEAALLTYIQENNFEFINPITEEITPSETVVSDTWSKLNNN